MQKLFLSATHTHTGPVFEEGLYAIPKEGVLQPAEYTRFERASPRPDQTIVIYYDSYRNLVAQGVIPARQHYAEVIPEPSPAGP